MTIVAGFDVHRRQITFDALDTETGELTRGRIDATPAAVERWVARFEGREVQVALEACTGWLFVSRALERAGALAHLAEPVETSALRGRKRRAKTDREDARWLRTLLSEGGCRNPGSRRNTSGHGARARDCARRSSTSARSGCSAYRRRCFTTASVALPPSCTQAPGREFLKELELPADARERIAIALAMVDSLDGQLRPLESELRKLARRQTGCRALMGQFGMGELTALMTLCELGDVQRLSASRKAVRMAGIDIGVHRSDRRSRVGKLNRQGSPHLRWALYEPALSATRPKSPDHEDYLALKARGLTHTRASITIARKLARRSFHILRELGPAALEPITTT